MIYFNENILDADITYFHFYCILSVLAIMSNLLETRYLVILPIRMRPDYLIGLTPSSSEKLVQVI